MEKLLIEINGKDKTKEIYNYYISEDGMIQIKFINSKKYYGYSPSKVRITPRNELVLSGRQLVVYKGKVRVDVIKIIEIGDRVTQVFTEKINWYCSSSYVEVLLAKNKKIIQKNEFIFLDNQELSNVEELLYYDKYVKVKYASKDKYSLYSIGSIRVEVDEKVKYKDLLKYYEKIAEAKDKENDADLQGYLLKQIDEMNISKESSLVNYLSGTIGDRKKKDFQTIYPFGINLSQREAINNALENKISMIQGPPGTGKTQSIFNILANCIIQNKTVAVVSGNNEAVKNVQEKLEKENFGFLVAFLGNSYNKKAFFEKQISYPALLDEWKKTNSEKDELIKVVGECEEKLIKMLSEKNRLAEIEYLISEYSHEYKFFEEYLEKESHTKMKRLSFFKMKDANILELLIELEYNDTERMGVLDKVRYFIKFGVYDFKQFDELESIILGLKNYYYETKIKALNTEKKRIDHYLAKNSFEERLQLLTDSSKIYFKARLADRYGKKERMVFGQPTYLQYKEYKKFIEEYPITLSTTHAISKSKPHKFRFDYLIVDEASQVELVPGVIALNVAHNTVIVGDENQLPHIPINSVKLDQYEKWHKEYKIPSKYNYRENSLLGSFNLVFQDRIPKVLLREHYRCHLKIISFCNKKYYNNELICCSKSYGDKPLVLLQTVDGNHMRYGKNAINKITNVREMESLIDKSAMEKMGFDIHSDKSFGFMAPFRDQANLAKGLMPANFQKDTVHKFQGRECDIMLFSTVLDDKYVSKRLMNFVDEPKLLNVAVSRAKEKLVIASSINVFKRAKGEINDLVRHMEYYEDDSILLKSKVRSIFDLLYTDCTTQFQKKKRNKNWGKSRFDSENLMEDLIKEILNEKKYNQNKFKNEVYIKELLRDTSLLSDSELKYVQNGARIDFVLYNIHDKQPILAIEVDGFEFHENNPKQQIKDRLKDSILDKYGVPILRLKTNYSGEEEKIKRELDFQS